MAYQEKQPYRAQDYQQNHSLLQALEAGQGKGKKHSGYKCKKSTFKVDGTNDLTVDSWKFMDWDYKRDDLPTYARGLFTNHNSAGRAEIVTRGYDKFFNTGEVNDTKWENVKRRTRGPYELSVKENGCIIFLSGLEDGTLLVCSKHSTGTRGDVALSHAKAGERWAEKHLASVGKKAKDLALELRKRNVTAVAELCDDSFEEHVLAYEEKDAGLYLHGINLNVPEFATYSGSQVHKFADEWGFKKAEFIVKDDFDSTKTFLDKCAETGSFEGRDTEGFVIRCQKKLTGAGGDEWIDWFFKYKFEEPYLMYRQWREATKAVISGKAPRYKKHAKVTEQYLIFARRQFATNPGLSKAYQQNHGIIKLRDDFLNEIGKKGSDIINQEDEENGGSGRNVTNSIILVPVASIGCGKTTVALALVKLFGWGHVQNDNITGKKNRPQTFATQISNALANHPVVIADRNNHQKRERQQITDDLSKVIPDVRFVALHYVHHPKDIKLPAIRKATQERIFERGDNHQTIQAGTKSREEIIGIMEGFLQRFEPIENDTRPDNSFDEVIDLDVLADSRHNLELVANQLRSAFPKLIPEAPSPDDLDNAINEALESYTVDLKHDLSFRSNKAAGNKNARGNKPPNNTAAPHKRDTGPSYFALTLPAGQIRELLNNTFARLSPDKAAFYNMLNQTRRVQPGFHVTLAHRAQIKEFGAVWAEYMGHFNDAATAQATDNPKLGVCNVRLERVIWDGRVMCIVAKLLNAGWNTMSVARGSAVHVTVGTRDQGIKPKESNALIHEWERGEAGVEEIALGGIVVIGEGRAIVQ